MKIMHLLLTHRFAGSERYAIELANEQAQRHDVTLVVSRSGAEDRPDALAHRVDSAVRLIQVPGWKPLRILAARRAVRRLAPDVAHAHSQGGEQALRGVRGSCLRVSTLHVRYQARYQRHLDGLIAVAPWQLEHVPEPQRTHTQQVGNWTRASPFDAGARRRIRTQWNLRDGEFLIGALGRTVPSKGFDLLIEAFAHARLRDARLAIVGYGRQWADLRRMRAPSDIIMPGFATRPQEWYSAFDAFVSAAHDEPFGVAFLEAMAAGLPILATATRGARHLAAMIQRPLVPIGNVAALGDALRQLAEQHPPRRTYNLDGFRLPDQAAKIEQFYRLELAHLRMHGR